MRETRERFDLVLASGVLYHMVVPVELIARVAAITDASYFWTHYYDEAAFKARGFPAARIVDPQPAEYEGYRHATYRYEYRSAVQLQGFCGGTDSYASWLSRSDILGALRHFGLANIDIAYEEPNHPAGPAFALLARR